MNAASTPSGDTSQGWAGDAVTGSAGALPARPGGGRPPLYRALAALAASRSPRPTARDDLAYLLWAGLPLEEAARRLEIPAGAAGPGRGPHGPSGRAGHAAAA